MKRKRERNVKLNCSWAFVFIALNSYIPFANSVVVFLLSFFVFCWLLLFVSVFLSSSSFSSFRFASWGISQLNCQLSMLSHFNLVSGLISSQEMSAQFTFINYLIIKHTNTHMPLHTQNTLNTCCCCMHIDINYS